MYNAQSQSNLQNLYGLAAYPTPPPSLLPTLAARIMETQTDLVSDVRLESISGREVGQGPLVQVNAQILNLEL